MEIIKLFIKFSLVGLSGVGVNLAVYSFLIYFDIYYLLAATLSFLVAVSNNFYWNFIWTFKDRAEHKTVSKKYIHFFLVSLFNYFVNISILKIMVSVFAYNKLFSQVIAIGTASVLNFIGNYLITFREK